MRRNVHSLAVLALMAALPACSGGETRSAMPVPAKSNLSQLSHERVKGVDVYGSQGRRLTDEAKLIEAMESAMNAEIEKIVPETPGDKSLRVVLPPAWEAERGVGRYYRRLDELRLAALRKSATFTDFEIETLSQPDPDTGGRDLVLYRWGESWRLKDAQGRVERLLPATGAQAFVSLVRDAMKQLAGDELGLGAMRLDGKVIYNFKGREYTGMRGLRQGLDQNLAEEEKLVVGMAPSLADSALVVLPRDSRFNDMLAQPLARISWSEETKPGLQAFQRYLDRRTGQFIAASGLFKTVRVVTADEAEPEQGGHDWVFWRQPGQHEWMMRPRNGEAFRDTMPAKPESFAEDLRAKMTRPR